MGASLTVQAPTGEYDGMKLINIGTNRWAFKPELGFRWTPGRWTFELDAGVWVSAEPQVIAKMGVKSVLFRTRALGWGADTGLYRSVAGMELGLGERLSAGPRVMKRERGNGGIGVFKVTPTGADQVEVMEARRGSALREARRASRRIATFSQISVANPAMPVSISRLRYMLSATTGAPR